MKKNFLKSLLGLVLIAFTFSGCDKLDDAGDITFDTEFTLPEGFEISEQDDETHNPYTSLNSSIEAEDDPQYLQYKAKIKSIRVNKIKYTISGLSTPDGPVTLTSGMAIFFESGGSALTGEIASVENLLLVEGSGELEASQDALDKIGDILLEDGEVFVSTVANLSDAPCFFNITVTLEVTIIASALN